MPANRILNCFMMFPLIFQYRILLLLNDCGAHIENAQLKTVTAFRRTACNDALIRFGWLRTIVKAYNL